MGCKLMLILNGALTRRHYCGGEKQVAMWWARNLSTLGANVVVCSIAMVIGCN